MLLSELLSDEELSEELPRVVIAGITDDTRQLQAGSCQLISVQDPSMRDRLLQEALEKKAGAVVLTGETASVTFQQTIPIITLKNLAERMGPIAAKFYQYPAADMNMIGITGTNGKTSLSHYIATILNQSGVRTGIIGTIGNGWPEDLQAGDFTTPTAVLLQKTLAQFKADHAKAIAMEVSSHALDQGRVNGVPFRHAIFTNLSRDHLDYHHTMENYAAAKARLFQWPSLQSAIINLDDPFGIKLITQLPENVRCIAYSTEARSHSAETEQTLARVERIYAENINVSTSGMTATIFSPWGEGQLKTQLLGRFTISNLLAVLAVLGVNGIAWSAALDYIATLSAVPGRLQKISHHGWPLAVVDYSHTPDALLNALKACREQSSGKIWCVFGCGGDRDRGKRPLMAEIAEKYADHVIVTDDNPRSENAEEIFQDIFKGFHSTHRIAAEHDRALAIQLALTRAQIDDIVLIAGKGHETYQIIGREKRYFSDVAEVEKVFKGKGAGPLPLN